jgi:hypothetical protein
MPDDYMKPVHKSDRRSLGGAGLLFSQILFARAPQNSDIVLIDPARK